MHHLNLVNVSTCASPIRTCVCCPRAGLTHTIIAVVLVELLGVELFVRSMALYNFVMGIVVLLATPLCGESLAQLVILSHLTIRLAGILLYG